MRNVFTRVQQFSIEWSDDSDFHDHSKGFGTDEVTTCECCTIYDAGRNILASLSCIDDADDDYRKDVESRLLREIWHG